MLFVIIDGARLIVCMYFMWAAILIMAAALFFEGRRTMRMQRKIETLEKELRDEMRNISGALVQIELYRIEQELNDLQ